MNKLITYLRKVIPHNSLVRLWYTRLQQVAALILIPIDTKKLQQIKLIGVTGTDGKTTTVEMVAHILGELSVPYLSTSSLEAKLSGEKLTASKRTTPSLWALRKLLKQALSSGARVAVIEVSSHALVQWRVLGLKFDVAVLTNITHEHLNYHKTLEAYADAKKLLFTKYLKSSGVAILPSDDEYGGKWLSELANLLDKTLPYSALETDATTINNGTRFTHNNKEYTLPMLGEYNASNAVAGALAVSSALNLAATPKPGFGVDEALQTMSNFSGIPGRMQLVQVPATKPGLVATVIVDFALTERAMTSALATARKLATPAEPNEDSGKVIVVFGASGGQHDASVHPGLARAAARGANVCIVTDDEPYDGDPATIRANLIDHIKEAVITGNLNTKYKNIADRREAIHTALSLANSGDVVIVTGMGHYTSRTVGDKEVPWSDVKVIKEELGKLQQTCV